MRGLLIINAGNVRKVIKANSWNQEDIYKKSAGLKQQIEEDTEVPPGQPYEVFLLLPSKMNFDGFNEEEN